MRSAIKVKYIPSLLDKLNQLTNVQCSLLFLSVEINYKCNEYLLLFNFINDIKNILYNVNNTLICLHFFFW